MVNRHNLKSEGWNWLAFIFGPLWYLAHGLILKGIIMILITIATFGFGFPIIWIYCGIRANSDYFEKQLKTHSKYSPNKIEES
ncbi:MAG: DUF2628 domain-containing protein [Candidatus Cloacimonetes bacterium]|nr:DUF2628 domain-containing protein [Candidatus Cloacimonadota bacterium]